MISTEVSSLAAHNIPEKNLAKCVSDFLYHDLDHMSLQISKIMPMISHVSTSAISIMMTPAMCTMAFALLRDADSLCAAFASIMHSFDQPIPSIRY
jgi:hypothetical protein